MKKLLQALAFCFLSLVTYSQCSVSGMSASFFLNNQAGNDCDVDFVFTWTSFVDIEDFDFEVDGTTCTINALASDLTVTLNCVVPCDQDAVLLIEGFDNTSTSCYTETITISEPLPVELIFFRGQMEGEGAMLTWQTASEEDNKGFIVQNSFNGIDFFDIGFVAGVGSSSEIQNYSFFDADTPQGQSYYRLKQLDFDGGFDYSNIISLINRTENFASVFPNPSSSIINIVTQIDGDLPFQILDISGRSLISGVLSTEREVDISFLPNGLFVVNTPSFQTKFIKIN